MNDALGMRGGQGPRDLRAILNGLLDGELAAFQARRQCLTLHQLHHQVIGADVVQRADVGMVQCGDGSGFAFKPVGELFLRDFYGHLAAQARVGCAEHLTHAAVAQQGFDLVRAQLRSGHYQG